MILQKEIIAMEVEEVLLDNLKLEELVWQVMIRVVACIVIR